MALEPKEIEAQVFRCLGDSARRQMVELLADSPGMTVLELCAHFPTSRFAVMKHLNILEESGIVRRERVGTTKQLYVDKTFIHRVLSLWMSQIGEEKS